MCMCVWGEGWNNGEKYRAGPHARCTALAGANFGRGGKGREEGRKGEGGEKNGIFFVRLLLFYLCVCWRVESQGVLGWRLYLCAFVCVRERVMYTQVCTYVCVCVCVCAVDMATECGRDGGLR